MVSQRPLVRFDCGGYYVPRMIDRGLLPKCERRAVVAALSALVRDVGGQTNAAKLIGMSQQAVAKAVKHDQAGPGLARNLLEYLKTDMPSLVAKYGGPRDLDDEPLLHLDRADPYPERAMAIALARLADIGDDACQAVRKVTVTPGQVRPVAWWLRAVLNADELTRSFTPPAVTPAPAPKPNLSNSPLMQHGFRQRARDAAAAAKSGQDQKKNEKSRSAHKER